MTTAPPTIGQTRLAQMARRGPHAGSTDDLDRCGLCAQPILDEHRHVIDLDTSMLHCACQACSLLFDHEAAGGDHYALVPDRRQRIDPFDLDDTAWSRLGVPVGLAYFVQRSAPPRDSAGRGSAVAVVYPGPAGTVESDVDLQLWDGVVERNPVLAELAPAVEGLLVRRYGPHHDHWLVPISDCYRLAATLRAHWHGLSGGDEVWPAVDRFFAGLAD